MVVGNIEAARALEYSVSMSIEQYERGMWVRRKRSGVEDVDKRRGVEVDDSVGLKCSVWQEPRKYSRIKEGCSQIPPLQVQENLQTLLLQNTSSCSQLAQPARNGNQNLNVLTCEAEFSLDHPLVHFSLLTRHRSFDSKQEPPALF